MRNINQITVEEPDKKKEFSKRIKSKSEDILFFIIELLPEKLIPDFVMNWIDKYIDMRMNELKQEHIKANWNKTYIEKAVEELKSK